MENKEQNAPLFHTSMNGYRKDDVNRYISYVNSNFKGVETTLKNTITGQKNELIRLNEEVEKLQAEIAERDKKTEEEQEAVQQNAALRAQLDCYIVEKAKAESEKEELLKELNLLREWKSKADTIPVASDELLKKAAQYDLIAEGIGTWMQNAAEQAQTVINNARLEAQRIIDGANSQANRETVETARREMNDQFRRITENCCQGLVAKIGTVQSGLSTLMDEIRNQYSEMDFMAEKPESDDTTAR